MPEHPPDREPRRRFFWGRVESFRFAVQGVVYMLRSQRNAWIHAVMSLAVIAAGIVFGGWANCLGPPEAFAAEDYGAMGIHMPGIAVSPSGGISPVQTTSWGKLKSLYR